MGGVRSLAACDSSSRRNARSRRIAVEAASTPPTLLTGVDQEWLLARARLAALYRRVGRMQEGAAVEAQLRAAMAVADDDFPIKRRLAATAVR